VKLESDKPGSFEKVFLFVQAPITIFMVDAFLQILANVTFMFILFGEDRSAKGLSDTEYYLAIFMFSTTVTEMMQSVVEGPSYFTNTWNVVRVASCGFFWMGIHTVVSQGQKEELCKLEGANCTRPGPTKSGEKIWDEGESMYYSASLFFMWLRMLHLLAVHQDLGPLVVVFRRMMRDFLTFGGIWAVLLLAFSCAMQGTGLNQPVEHCEVGETHKMNCWRSWWLIRTYYQSFGQPFFEELTNDAANEVTILMWPIMNLMMVNLLIAMMNSTYTEVKEQAKLEWMIEMLHIAKEYRSPSRLNVVMFLWDILSFMWRKTEVDARMKKLVETPGVGLLGWYEDNRFKFKKFQCGDLPAIEITEEIKDLRKLLDKLEQEDIEGGPPTPNKVGGKKGTPRKVTAHEREVLLARKKRLRGKGWIMDCVEFVIYPVRWLIIFSWLYQLISFSSRLILVVLGWCFPPIARAYDKKFIRSRRNAKKAAIKMKIWQLEKQRKANGDELRRLTEFVVHAKLEYLKSRGVAFMDDQPAVRKLHFKKPGEGRQKAARARSNASSSLASQA